MWLLLHIHSLADSFIHSFIDLTCLSLCQVLSANRADVCLGEGTRSAAETVQRNLLVNVRALWLQKGAALLLKQMGESRHRVQPVQMKIVLCIAGRMDTCLRGRGPVLTQGWVAWGGGSPADLCSPPSNYTLMCPFSSRGASHRPELMGGA